MIYNLSQYNIHWKTKRLNQLGVFSRGKSKHRPRDDYRLFINGKYPLIQTSDIKKANLYVTSHVQEYNEFGLQQSKLWNKGTLCITIAANIADTAIISYPMCFPDSVVGFLANKNESSELFMHYIFKYIQNNIKKTVRGSIQDNININYLEQLYFKIPEKAYQNKIVLILSSIDKKIELNNKINTELEAMAKIIYDYWFLQFEFPNEEGKPYKSSGGKMVWNEELKREIPEGWKVNNILNVCDVVDCLHSKKPTYCKEYEDYYLLTLENLTEKGYIDLSKKYYISKTDYEKWTSRILVKENDFVVTNAGRAGDIGKIPYGVKCAIGRNLTAIRPKNINPYYLRQFFKSNYLKEQVLSNLDCGSFFMSFNVKSIKSLNVLIPNEDIMKKSIDILKPIILKIENNIVENQELTSLRDFLLPLLMNGQVGFKGDKAEG